MAALCFRRGQKLMGKSYEESLLIGFIFLLYFDRFQEAAGELKKLGN